MTAIRVLIVDDQDVVRHGLGVILSHQPGIEVAGYAADGQEALEQAAALRPHVALMDLKMPRMNGIQATRQISRQFPAVKVVVLTTYDGDEWVFDAIRAGASGYLLKDSDGAEIVAAVRGAAVGEVRIDPAVAGKVLQEFNRLAGPMSRHSNAAVSPRSGQLQIEELTERELNVLQELVQGKSNHEIADSLHLAEGTVKNYVSSIIDKLQANDRTQAAILALKRGLATLE
jgi:DNA-binding NarL/FixJ family response regulator